MTDERRVASAIATGTTTCLYLSKESFNQAIKTEGEVSSFLYKLLQERKGVREERA